MKNNDENLKDKIKKIEQEFPGITNKLKNYDATEDFKTKPLSGRFDRRHVTGVAYLDMGCRPNHRTPDRIVVANWYGESWSGNNHTGIGWNRRLGIYESVLDEYGIKAVEIGDHRKRLPHPHDNNSFFPPKTDTISYSIETIRTIMLPVLVVRDSYDPKKDNFNLRDFDGVKIEQTGKNKVSVAMYNGEIIGPVYILDFTQANPVQEESMLENR